MSTKSEIEEIFNQEEYSFEKKERMASKISDMRDVDTLRKIRDIIYSENVNASATKSGNGYLMYFQNYSDETYRKIEKLLHKIQKEKLERQTRSVTEMSSEDPNTNYNVSRTRLRYSNREKRLIKRQQYENIINAQGPLYEITGQELQTGIMPFPEIDGKIEGQGNDYPDSAPDKSLSDRNDMIFAMEYPQIHSQ